MRKWIIIKSAGDNYSFTTWPTDENFGHTYEYAQSLAKRVTAAMKRLEEDENKESTMLTEKEPMTR